MNPGLSYRRAAAGGASPVRLVILLYEQMIEDLRRAAAAQQHGQIEERTHQLNHALLVLAHLESTLDKNQGGGVAPQLERFYRQVRASLVDAQARQSSEAIEKQVSLLMLVREAWDEVERSISENPAPASSAIQRSTEPHSSTDWKA